MKYLMWLVLIVVVWLWWSKRQAADAARHTAEKPAGKADERMVACARCGVFVPESDALPGNGGAYCCAAHRAEAERPAPR